jgi:hypothetical protein
MLGRTVRGVVGGCGSERLRVAGETVCDRDALEIKKLAGVR